MLSLHSSLSSIVESSSRIDKAALPLMRSRFHTYFFLHPMIQVSRSFMTTMKIARRRTTLSNYEDNSAAAGLECLINSLIILLHFLSFVSIIFIESFSSFCCVVHNFFFVSSSFYDLLFYVLEFVLGPHTSTLQPNFCELFDIYHCSAKAQKLICMKSHVSFCSRKKSCMVICSRLKKSFVLQLRNHNVRFTILVARSEQVFSRVLAIAMAMYYDGEKRRGFEDLNINFDFHYFSITFHFSRRIVNFSAARAGWRAVLGNDIKVSEVEWLVKC